MRLLMVISIGVAAVAAIDAARGGHWDQFVMLLILAVVAGVALVAQARAARSVRLRADLLAWVTQHAALTDDEIERVVDRAVSAYRDRLLPDGEAGVGAD